MFPGDFPLAIGQRKFHEREQCLLSPWAVFVLVYEAPDQASSQSVSLFTGCQHLCCEHLYTFNGTSVVCAQMIPHLLLHFVWNSSDVGCSPGLKTERVFQRGKNSGTEFNKVQCES